MPRLRDVLLLVLLPALMTACTVTLDPPRTESVVVTRTAPASGSRVEPINDYLGLLPYPDSTVTRRSSDGRDSETRFTTTAGLRQVHQYFHDQLVRDGWRRTDLEVKRDKIEAEYRRNGAEFEFELKQKKDARFELEIDFD